MKEAHHTPVSANQNSLAIHTSILCGLADEGEQEFDDAFVKFVERHYRHMMSWFQRFSHLKEQDREDAVHDFFLSIRHKIRSNRSRQILRTFADDPTDGKDKFRSWLWCIAKHASVDFIRSRKNKSHLQLETSADGSTFEASLCREIEYVLKEDFETMLVEIGKRVIGISLESSGRVGSSDWDVYVLRYSLTNQELSDKFGKSLRAIEQSLYRVNRGLSKIRHELIEQYGSISQFVWPIDVSPVEPTNEQA